MATGNKKKKSGNDNKSERFSKKKIKHDPQAESARAIFGKAEKE